MVYRSVERLTGAKSTAVMESSSSSGTEKAFQLATSSPLPLCSLLESLHTTACVGKIHYNILTITHFNISDIEIDDLESPEWPLCVKIYLGLGYRTHVHNYLNV